MSKIIIDKLTNALNPTYLEVIDESHLHAGHMGHKPGIPTHFRVTIVSTAFQGLTPLACHRLVYKVLSQEMPDIHALALDTKTPSM